MNQKELLKDHLHGLYGSTLAEHILARIEALFAKFQTNNPHIFRKTKTGRKAPSQRDIILITYGDMFTEPGKSPLQSLNHFLNIYVQDSISGVHLLPFFPYSSDDGFSIIDYRTVRPDLGTWDDIQAIGQNYLLMFDAVINHISQHSDWFKRFLRNQAPYKDYFVLTDPSANLSQVVRPRTSPLIKTVYTADGAKYVWTTFSEDQVDLNYANPDVLVEIINVLLLYVEKGAEIIRLDAAAYLWKEVGTTCIHLPQTHRLVKLLRAILDLIAPNVLLITETNVPHNENIRYFGDSLPGSDNFDEAQLVYQFPLAPLVLHALITGDAQTLTRWASDLQTPSDSTTFFNFTASHDGIGVIPARDLLEEHQVRALVDRTTAHGGYVSYKSNSDGSQSPYELNITWFDALNNPNIPTDDEAIDRFMASQAIMLSLAGVPGIYVHSLFGSHNCNHLVAETGNFRSINRERFSLLRLHSELGDPLSIKSRILSKYKRLLNERRKRPAFHPNAKQQVIFLQEALFTLVRSSGTDEVVVCIINVSSERRNLQFELSEWELPNFTVWHDLIQGNIYRAQEGNLSFSIRGYQAVWLRGMSP